ncbi:MAG: hypothetical protein GC129_03510 [Proteobacteria bacterium]|nr:hypothetical protein [Pseudomonadota bacterium]
MNITIFHGTKGSPQGNWFPWLKAKLEGQGHQVFVPKFPTPDGQSKENWCAALRDQAPMFGGESILIGHSLGATLVMHVLEMKSSPIHQAILVSPVSTAIGNAEYDALNQTFYSHPFSWAKVKAGAKTLTILHGSDDPYVPLAHTQKLAANLGVEPIVIPGGGHLNAESGYREFPQIMELIA